MMGLDVNRRLKNSYGTIRHAEPGPEPCPETSSGSIEPRIFDFSISMKSTNYETLNQVQGDR
jgi:hypothetical protein